MHSKNDIKSELVSLRKELRRLKTREAEFESAVNGKENDEKMSSNLLQLFKIMMDENKKTTILIQHISEKLSHFEEEVANVGYEEVPQAQEGPSTKEIPISDLDKKIIQFIQLKELACAEDVRKHMGYKGKNAASSRLNRLYKQGLIERHQLGHKVFYKYNAGKTTNNILIVSPPQ